MLAEFMNEYAMEIIAAVLTAVMGYIGMLTKQLFKRWLDTADKKRFALASVRYVEQVYKDLHGRQKMRQALAKFQKLLDGYGIRCSATEMEALLEAAVNEMNAQAGWAIDGVPLESAVLEIPEPRAVTKKED